MSKHDPSIEPGEKAKALHKIAFPEVYETDEVDKAKELIASAIPETPPENTEPDADQKYTTLLNKYNSEVPRLHSWVRDRDQKIAALQTELDSMKTEIQSIKTQNIADKSPTLATEGEYTSPHVTPEMRATDSYLYLFDTYGQTHAERVTENNVLVAKNVGRPIEEKLDKVSQNTEDLTTTTAEQQFHKDLHGLCPSWTGLNTGVNVDPAFMEWLQTPAPGTGSNYHKLINDAYQNADSDAMAEVINFYESQKKPTATKSKVPDDQIVPNKSGGGQQTILDNAKGDVLRFSDMQQIYKDYNDGKYRGKEAEYQKKKDAFMKAQMEGRLVK